MKPVRKAATVPPILGAYEERRITDMKKAYESYIYIHRLLAHAMGLISVHQIYYMIFGNRDSRLIVVRFVRNQLLARDIRNVINKTALLFEIFSFFAQFPISFSDYFPKVAWTLRIAVMTMVHSFPLTLSQSDHDTKILSGSGVALKITCVP